MSDSLGIDDDVMGLAMLTVGNDIIDNILFVVIVLLGKQDILGAVGNTAPSPASRYLRTISRNCSQNTVLSSLSSPSSSLSSAG